MAGDPFVAQISMVSFNFAPTGWAHCNGQLMPISQNTALFSLLGTTYGGNGKSTFALPDFQGRAPMHPEQGPGLSLHDLGETGGHETVTLLDAQMPAHSHEAQAVFPIGDDSKPEALTDNPVNSFPIEQTKKDEPMAEADILFSSSGSENSGTFKPEIKVHPSGGGLPHNNMQPYLTVNFIIALQGVFPQRP